MLRKCLVSILLLLLTSGGSFACRNPEVTDLIILSFYTTPTHFQSYTIHNFHEILNHPQFQSNRNTVMFHYGLSQTPGTPSVVEITEAYLQAGNVNFVLINYASIATNVSSNACTMGESLAEALVRLFNLGYDPSRMHLVGFSFGSTVFGITGREVISQSTGAYMIERITGLDPGQLPETIISMAGGRIGPGDARFVDTIHTEAVGFGDLEAAGHVQYFVNGGVTQPMCTSVINTVAQTCSHLFASTIWVESIRAQSPIFPSLQCQSWNHFLNNDCNPNAPVGNLGVLTSTALRGSYFLRTNNEAPFSRNTAGP